MAGIDRRGFLTATGLALAAGRARGGTAVSRVPVIDTTDLYHPHQDVGDNLDLIAAYGLPEIDLRAVVLDATERFRDPATEGIARDPGFVPVLQLNRIFGRAVPFGVGPLRALRDPRDDATDAPDDEQTGIRLLLDTLAHSESPVEITVFGSARVVTAAWNRAPDLMLAKTRLVHLCAGSSDPSFVEWNVALDPDAMVGLLRSELPVAIYPCATADGPFAYGERNGYWLLPDLGFLARTHPAVRSYAAYALSRSSRSDFLRAVEEPVDDSTLLPLLARPHSVWETCVWAAISGRVLARRPGEMWRLVPRGEVGRDAETIAERLQPVRIRARPNGVFDWRPASGPTRTLLYDRGDPLRYEQAAREALPALYEAFRPR